MGNSQSDTGSASARVIDINYDFSGMEYDMFKQILTQFSKLIDSKLGSIQIISEYRQNLSDEIYSMIDEFVIQKHIIRLDLYENRDKTITLQFPKDTTDIINYLVFSHTARFKLNLGILLRLKLKLFFFIVFLKSLENVEIVTDIIVQLTDMLQKLPDMILFHKVKDTHLLFPLKCSPSFYDLTRHITEYRNHISDIPLKILMNQPSFLEYPDIYEKEKLLLVRNINLYYPFVPITSDGPIPYLSDNILLDVNVINEKYYLEEDKDNFFRAVSRVLKTKYKDDTNFDYTVDFLKEVYKVDEVHVDQPYNYAAIINNTVLTEFGYTVVILHLNSAGSISIKIGEQTQFRNPTKEILENPSQMFKPIFLYDYSAELTNSNYYLPLDHIGNDTFHILASPHDYPILDSRMNFMLRCFNSPPKKDLNLDNILSTNEFNEDRQIFINYYNEHPMHKNAEAAHPNPQDDDERARMGERLMKIDSLRVYNALPQSHKNVGDKEEDKEKIGFEHIKESFRMKNIIQRNVSPQSLSSSFLPAQSAAPSTYQVFDDTTSLQPRNAAAAATLTDTPFLHPKELTSSEFTDDTHYLFSGSEQEEKEILIHYYNNHDSVLNPMSTPLVPKDDNEKAAWGKNLMMKDAHQFFDKIPESQKDPNFMNFMDPGDKIVYAYRMMIELYRKNLCKKCITLPSPMKDVIDKTYPEAIISEEELRYIIQNQPVPKYGDYRDEFSFVSIPFNVYVMLLCRDVDMRLLKDYLFSGIPDIRSVINLLKTKNIKLIPKVIPDIERLVELKKLIKCVAEKAVYRDPQIYRSIDQENLEIGKVYKLFVYIESHLIDRTEAGSPQSFDDKDMEIHGVSQRKPLLNGVMIYARLVGKSMTLKHRYGYSSHIIENHNMCLRFDVIENMGENKHITFRYIDIYIAFNMDTGYHFRTYDDGNYENTYYVSKFFHELYEHSLTQYTPSPNPPNPNEIIFKNYFLYALITDAEEHIASKLYISKSFANKELMDLKYQSSSNLTAQLPKDIIKIIIDYYSADPINIKIDHQLLMNPEDPIHKGNPPIPPDIIETIRIYYSGDLCSYYSRYGVPAQPINRCTVDALTLSSMSNPFNQELEQKTELVREQAQAQVQAQPSDIIILDYTTFEIIRRHQPSRSTSALKIEQLDGGAYKKKYINNNSDFFYHCF